MDSVDLILVGCGTMGTRHLRGHAELERARPGSLRLRAVCDPRPEAAERLAAEAETLLGYRPRPCRSAAEALEREPGIVAADVVTENRSHPQVVIPLLEAGVHVQVEKPLAVNVARGRAMLDAARRCGRILTVAENYRRDPMARLLRHLLESGAVGKPAFAAQIQVAPGQQVVVTPWRHAWRHGGLALDVGVHYADMLEYLLGPVTTVCAAGSRVRETRGWTGPDGVAQTVPVECDDLYSALLTFESGVQGVWIMHLGSSGERQWQRTVHGSEGMAAGPADRTGSPVRLQRGTETLEGEALLAAFPDYRLGGVESMLFGARPASYRMEFAEIDRKLIAVETADFLDAVRDSRPPEVTPEAGLRAVALVMSILESAHTGAPVRVDEVVSGAVRSFQDRLEALGDGGAL
jgi:predicted dehydrogenase